jgi:hypothetical protein
MYEKEFEPVEWDFDVSSELPGRWDGVKFVGMPDINSSIRSSGFCDMQKLPEHLAKVVHLPTLYRSRCTLEKLIRNPSLEPFYPRYHVRREDSLKIHQRACYTARFLGPYLITGSRDKRVAVTHFKHGIREHPPPSPVYIEVHSGTVLRVDGVFDRAGNGILVSASSDGGIFVSQLHVTDGDVNIETINSFSHRGVRDVVMRKDKIISVSVGKATDCAMEVN